MSTREIDVRVSNFVSELETLIRAAALEAVQAALGAAQAPKAVAASPKPKASKPAAKASKPAAKASKPAAKASEAAPKASEAAPKASEAAAPKATAAETSSAAALPRVKKGARRSAADVAAAARAIKQHLAANPGQGVEAIAKALGAPSKDLALPIANLLGARSIRKEGEKRGTRYFVTGSSEGKAPLAPEPPKAAAPAAKPPVPAKPAPAPAPEAKKADKPAKDKGKKGKKK